MSAISEIGSIDLGNYSFHVTHEYLVLGIAEGRGQAYLYAKTST